MATPFSLCLTCGVEHAHPLPEVCAICADERQYLPEDGLQRWVSLDDLQQDRNLEIFEMEPGLLGLNTTPPVGIGHRPVLVQTPEGNLLWDPPAYIDNAAVELMQSVGGVSWIAASHPHMFGVQLEWSAAFDNASVYVNSHDAEWLARPGDAVAPWDDEVKLTSNLKLIRVGGHFPGSAIALWRGADGKGVVLSSDTILPVAAEGWVTFLRSYPNRFPLSGGTVKRIADQMATLDFDRMYGNFQSRPINAGAKEAVQRSAERHIAWVSGDFDHLT